MRTKIIILTAALLLTGVYSLDAKSNKDNASEESEASSENIEIQLQVKKNSYNSNKRKKDSSKSKSNKSLVKQEITLADINESNNSENFKYGSLNSPSKRMKHEWDDDFNANSVLIESTSESTVVIKKEYKSAIAKIREAEESIEKVEQKSAWVSKINSEDYMEVFISGGGYKNGVDARLHDRIMINNAGYIESYYESEISGVKKTVKTVKKEDLAEFVKWIAEKGFFEFEREYDCYSTDAECQNRLKRRPQPIPLKIVVAVGERRNVVVVPIFSPNIEKNYIEYPKELIQIVEAIYLFASL